MRRIGITGCIGSGKSYVCRLIRARGEQVYDCDTEAKRLMRCSQDLRAQLMKLIGHDAYTAEGTLNKAVVAKFLLASKHNASAIDAVVHPAVVADFVASGQRWVESALLYKAGIDRVVDSVIVVTAPENVRVERIMKRDHITEEKARQWIAAQAPQEELAKRADFIIVNDGVADIEKQLNTILNKICN